VRREFRTAPADARAHPNAGRNTIAHAVAGSNAVTHADPNSNAVAHAVANSNAVAHAVANSDTVARADPNSNAVTDACAKNAARHLHTNRYRNRRQRRSGQHACDTGGPIITERSGAANRRGSHGKLVFRT
jgi:hypothetical protein